MASTIVLEVQLPVQLYLNLELVSSPMGNCFSDSGRCSAAAAAPPLLYPTSCVKLSWACPISAPDRYLPAGFDPVAGAAADPGRLVEALFVVWDEE